MSLNKGNKGKGIATDSDWSEWVWDARGFYISSRTTSSGEIEHEHRYFETPNSATDQSIPRFTGSNESQKEDYHSPPLLSSAGSSYPPDSNDSYTTRSSTNASSQYATTPSYGSGARFSYPTSNTSYFYHTPPGSSFSSESSPPAGTSGYVPIQSAVYDPKGSSNSPGGSNSLDGITPSFQKTSISSVPPTIYEKNHASQNNASGNPQSITPKRIRRAPNTSTYEDLDPRYCVVAPKDLQKFYKLGRVFMMLWTEPAGHKAAKEGGTRNGSHISTTWLNGNAHSEIRRFVVVRANHGSCSCLAIHTYSGSATLKPNLPDPDNHAIIHTTPDPPSPLPKELLTKDPIRVISEQKPPDGILLPTSRINYTKVYTVEYDVRVLKIGMVHEDSLHILNADSPIRPAASSTRKARSHHSSNSGHGRGHNSDAGSSSQSKGSRHKKKK